MCGGVASRKRPQSVEAKKGCALISPIASRSLRSRMRPRMREIASADSRASGGKVSVCS